MKNLIFNSAILFCIFFCSTGLKSAKQNKLKYDSLSCLRIEGIVTNAGDGIDGECKIELIGLNDVSDSLILREGKRKFKFMLSKNSYYAIRISKKGYISKLVSVNTEMLVENGNIHVFEFETSLMREEALERLNKDMLDFPVAIIHFDYEADCFSYNKEYSAFIKRELYNNVKNAKPIHVKPARKTTLAPLTTNRAFASASN
jgi:hypothetical protein